MEKDKNQSIGQMIINIIILLLLLIGFGYLFLRIVAKVPEFLAKFSTLDTAIIVALITATVSVVTYVAGNITSGIMAKNAYLRDKRKDPYYQLISIFYDIQAAHRDGRDMSQQKISEMFNKFSKELTLWGSSKAIVLWGKWRIQAAQEGSGIEEMLFGMEKVLIQLRRDMGMKRGLKRGDLLRLFINDIDEYITEQK